MFVLRDYQIISVEKGLEILQAKSKKSILVAPTGAGKSIIIAEIAKRLDSPIIILQPSKELLKQNYTKFVNVGGKATIFCASLKVKTKNKQNFTVINSSFKRCDEASKITFATIGSIIKETHTFKKLGVKHIIIDEVHLGTSVDSQIRRFIKALNVKNVLGLTATPIYLKGGMYGSRLIMINKAQHSMFKSICHVTQIKELVDKKFWTPFKYKIAETNTSYLKLNSSGAEYTESSQNFYYESNKLHEKIVEEIKLLRSQGRKRILVFLPSIQQANLLYSMVPNSAVVHSKLSVSERDLMVEEFTNGDIPVAFNVNVLATGYDNPEIDAIITARPTASIAIFYQQLGRGCRLHPNKKDCVIVDFSGNTKKFGKIEEIKFLDVEDYGWGMFGENNMLLSDIPIGSNKSLNDLNKEVKFQKEKEIKLKEELSKPIALWFGKYKGKPLLEAIKQDQNYFKWVYQNFDFNSDKMLNLKSKLEKHFS